MCGKKCVFKKKNFFSQKLFPGKKNTQYVLADEGLSFFY